MGAIFPKNAQQAFADILWLDNNGEGLDTTLRPIADGNGGLLPIKVATTGIEITGTVNFKQGVSLEAALNCGDQEISQAELKDYSEAVGSGNSGTSYDIDLEDGNVHEVTLTDDCTFTFVNPPIAGKAGSFTLILKQDATGSRATTWPASVLWSGDNAPFLSTGANEVDVLTLFTTDAGTTWYGMLAGLAFA